MADLIYWKGNRSPSITGTITVDDLPFNLTGSSVRFRARAENASAVAIDDPASIVDAPDGTVQYDPTATFAALAAGDYAAWWRVTLPSTLVQESPEFGLTIIDHAPLTRALCELEDVIAYAPGYDAGTRTDAVLEQMILAESHDIMRTTGREFKAISPAVNPRRFDIGEWEVAYRKVRIGELAVAPTSVTQIAFDQTTTVATVTSSAVALPRVREEWEPITHLYFPELASGSPTFQVGQVLAVDATAWGYPSVPPDLREACARIVVFRYVNDVTAAGSSFAEALAGVNVGALFAAGTAVVDRYKRAPIA